MSEDSTAGAEAAFASTASPSIGGDSTSYAANMTTINHLPNELLAKVFSYLPVEDLAICSHFICKRWVFISQDSYVWKTKVYEVTTHIPLSMHLQIFKLCPKLSGICIPKSGTQDDLTTVCRSIVRHVKNLKILSVPVDVSIIRPVKKFLLAKKKTIVNLDLRFCNDLNMYKFMKVCSEEILPCVALCRNLQCLSLRGLVSCDTNTLEAITHNCTRLQTLKLGECEMLGPQNGLECLLKGANGLTTLYFILSGLEQGMLPLIVKNCPELEKLYMIDLSYCEETRFDIVALKDLHYLKELFLSNVQVNILTQSISLFESGSMKNLVKLDLRYNKWVKNVFLDTVFKKCPNMQELSLKGCSELSSPAFENIYLLKNLQLLNLHGCVNLKDEEIFNIVKCKNIMSLNIKLISTFHRHILMLCENLQKLQKFYIDVDLISDNDLKKVPQNLLKHI